jgi:predicted ester cyclase
MSEENKAVVRRFNELFGECWRTGNVAILDEDLAPEFVYHSPGAPPDLGGFKQSLLMLSSGLHDLRYTVEDLFAEGDKVADRITWQVTHQGELMGISPTGNTVRGTEMHITAASPTERSWSVGAKGTTWRGREVVACRRT